MTIKTTYIILRLFTDDTMYVGGVISNYRTDKEVWKTTEICIAVVMNFLWAYISYEIFHKDAYQQ